MSKKKPSNRKHKFKHIEPSLPESLGSTPAPIAAGANNTRPVYAASSELVVSGYEYVGKDIRKILIIAAFLIFLEFIILFALNTIPFLKALT